MIHAELAVITRTRDRPLLLDRAARSVLGQECPDFAHVVVNDGGDPKEVERVLMPHRPAYGERLLVLHHPEPLGMEAASNAGIRASSSRYLAIHDDDDTWAPAFVTKTLGFLGGDQGDGFKGVVTHSDRVVEAMGNGRVRPVSREPFNAWLRQVTLYRMCACNCFPPISFVYERQALERIGPYREDLPVLGDWEFNLRFLSRFDIGVVPETLAFYHHRPDIDQGVYGNSVFSARERHVLYDAKLRNEYLRKDLEEGRQGLGHLMNLAQSFEIVHGQLGCAQQALATVTNPLGRLARSLPGRILSRLLGS